MLMLQIMLGILIVSVVAMAGALIWFVQDRSKAAARDLRDREELRDEMIEAIVNSVRQERKEVQQSVFTSEQSIRHNFLQLSEYVTDKQGKSADEVKRLNEIARESLKEMNTDMHKQMLAMQTMVDQRFAHLSVNGVEAAKALQAQLNEGINTMRGGLDANLEKIRQSNEQKLEAMRVTVQEKLDKTLEERLSASFRVVDEKLGMVQNGLGEMRTMAASVRDLKGVLTNVKTRGTFGETQLSVILDNLLTPGQYAEQYRVIPGSNAMVDFAVKMPGGTGEGPCWLPIDAKFPVEDYERLINAQTDGDTAAEKQARAALERAVLTQAKSIHEKYVRPPYTTDFAVMYLPSEGLYAEVLRIPGLFEKLQREHHITPTGPTVISALINSLQMGFVTLALQERSSEVWNTLAQVKSEFGRFADGFAKVQKKFSEAQNSLNAMQTRQNVMQKKMAHIESTTRNIAYDAPEEANEEANEAAGEAPATLTPVHAFPFSSEAGAEKALRH